MQRLIAFPLHLEASRYPRRTGGRTNPLGQWTPATHHRRRSDWLGYGCTRTNRLTTFFHSSGCLPSSPIPAVRLNKQVADGDQICPVGKHLYQGGIAIVSNQALEQRTDCSVLTHNVIRVPQMFNYSGDQAHFLKFMQTIGQHASRDYNECSSCDLEEPTEIQPDRPSEYCITQNYSQSQTGDRSNRSSARSGRCGERSVEEESRLQPSPQDCNEGQKANSPPRTERGGTTHPILYVDAHLCGLTAHPEHHERKYRHSEEAGDPLNNLPNRFR